MFWPDVLDYRRFYGSRLGQIAAHMLRELAKQRWGDGESNSILGLGYATPMLRPLREKARRALAFMPAQQGVIHWPAGQPNCSALADEADLPLPHDCVDRVIVMHVLEHTHSPQQVMQEIWRVLQPGGRALILVPNRRGIWAHMDHTPLGSGRPYSAPQLQKLLEQSRFTINDSGTLLFFPPTSSKWLLRSAVFMERLGKALLPWFGGVLWVEAEKQVYAILPKGGVPVERRRGPLILPEPVKPVMGFDKSG